MTEDQLEQETLAWLQDLGYAVQSGFDIAPDGPMPQRANYREVLLLGRLREAMARLNPDIPAAAREDAVQQVQNLGLPAQLAAIGRFTSCWWAACRCSTSRAVKRGATLCGWWIGRTPH